MPLVNSSATPGRYLGVELGDALSIAKKIDI